MTGRRHPEISNALACGGGVILASAHPRLRRTMEREVHRGTLVAPLPGILVPADSAAVPEVLARAVCVRYPSAVLAGSTAAGLTFWPAALRLPIVAHGLRPRGTVPWLRSSRAVIPAELVVATGGLCFTSPELTALDLAFESHGESIFALLRAGAGTVVGLQTALAVMAGYPGNALRARAAARAANNPWSGG